MEGPVAVEAPTRVLLCSKHPPPAPPLRVPLEDIASKRQEAARVDVLSVTLTGLGAWRPEFRSCEDLIVSLSGEAISPECMRLVGLRR